MKLLKESRAIKWLQLLSFYGTILIGTYFARKLPNLLNLVLERITDIPFTFNYNHGLVTLLVALLFYQYSGVKQEITLSGNNTFKSILFPVVLLAGYAAHGINNDHGMDRHLWALILCSFALLYNLMEEYAWRGYLVDSLSNVSFVWKSIISGVFWCIWHILVFNNFDQYGGFAMFMIFCLVFAFILTFAVIRTKSILVAGTMHAFIIQTNIVALVCFLVFMLLLLTWHKNPRWLSRGTGRPA